MPHVLRECLRIECSNTHKNTKYCSLECAHISTRQSQTKKYDDTHKRRARKYGLSHDELDELIQSADLCECCGTRPGTHIDHDHFTGEIRGVICDSCNVGIGRLGDSFEGVFKAAIYLSHQKQEIK